MAKKRTSSFRRQTATILIARTAINTAHRIVYPFLPSIARGLGISLTTASTVVSLRLTAGLIGPVLGPLSDRQPRRRVMEGALLAFVLASSLLVATGLIESTAGVLILAIAAFALFGLSKVVFDPAVLAYLGDAVPYSRRGRAVGIVELSWSAAWLIGVPLAGFLIDSVGWRAPWAVLAAWSVVSLGLIHAILPQGQAQTGTQNRASPPASLTSQWRNLLGRRRVVILLLVSMLLAAANEMPFIVYGAWLETAYGLSLTALGLASVVVGFAEASAEIGTTALTDRIGKRRSVLLGLFGMAASLMVLPSLARTGLGGALVGIVLVVLTFEFGIVSLLPLATELVPEARASVLSLNIAAFSIGRIAGAMLGGYLWQWRTDGIVVHAVVGAGCALAAALVLIWGMTDVEA
jgi:predicted MFS family arabinose efflux permease